MKAIRTIIKSILMTTLTGGLGWVLFSCSSDLDGSAQEEKGVPIQVEGYMPTFKEAEGLAPASAPEVKGTFWESDYGMTRTEPGWMPDGYTSFSDVKSIGAFFTQTSTCDAQRIWWHDEDKRWYLSGKTITAGDFYLYGYLPYNSANVAITPKNSNYAEGASLTFTDMSSVSTKDICVIVGASNGSNADTPTNLQTGKFNCQMKSGGTGNENHLFLLCDHLYAKLEFTFRVDDSEPYKYASLRTIKLRKLELTSYTYTLDNQSDTTIMKKKGNITVNLAANNTGTSPIESTIYFTPDIDSDNMDPVLLFEGEKTIPSVGYTTETGYVPYFNLSGSGKVLYVLRSTYDVYDKQNNLIRKGCVAENTIVPQERFNIKQFSRGHKYTLRLTVMPTYLYMLSEPDLNNPTIE